jgi:putative transposase
MSRIIECITCKSFWSMTEKFKNKYRISSARLQTWDYGSNGSYFVTICTYKRICYFGRIESGIMQLSDLGNIAQKCWQEIPNHFPFVELSEFVVMPNHVHGIITIMKPHQESDRIDNNGMGDNGGIGDDVV